MDRAAVRVGAAGQQVEQRGRVAPVRRHHPDPRPLLDGQVEVAQAAAGDAAQLQVALSGRAVAVDDGRRRVQQLGQPAGGRPHHRELGGQAAQRLQREDQEPGEADRPDQLADA